MNDSSDAKSETFLGKEPTGEHKAIVERDWRLSLIELLSKLETLRLQLEGSRTSNDAEHIVDRLEAMVLLTEEFSKTLDHPDASLDAHMTAMAKAGEFYAILNDCRAKLSRSLLKSVFSKFSSSEEPESISFVPICVQAGIDTLNAYFSLFTEMYQSSQKARAWVDAASAYLADFRQLARKMQSAS